MADANESSSSPAWAEAGYRTIHPLLALIAATCLLALVGWTGNLTGWEHKLTLFTGFAFSIEQFWAYWRVKSRGEEPQRPIFHLWLAAIVFPVTLILLLPVNNAGEWSMGSHVFVLMAVIISGLTSLIQHQTRFTARAFHPGRVLILSFLTIVVFGALLLKMPRCTVPGSTCSWIDAFFTSTSAVCVTGLAVQNTATFFTVTGQTVILLLIQIGGLGIMTLTFFVAVVLFEGISLHDRLLLGKMLQENRLARVGETLSFIVVMTFTCEAVGAVILFWGMDGIEDTGTRWFHAVFHSVSAFCNAGFSTLPNGLADDVIRGNQTWQICVMALIIIGGLGALAVEDVTHWTAAKIRRFRTKEGPHLRLRVHTRLVLVVTAALIVLGAAVIMVTEYVVWNGPSNGGNVLTAFFHSVTARTAGFNTVSMSHIGPITAQMLMILMLIGGSPGGTAGGLRTTVAAVGLAHLWSLLRNCRRGMVFFHRTIPAETGTQALGLIVLAGIWLTVNFVILQILEAGNGFSESTLLFELISAFATVGLSLDLTPELTSGTRILLIVNMFVGRIGLLAVMATFIPPDTRPPSGRPEENILLT